ncbi:MAG: hypothetical protein Q9203_002000 [Teloschistes exilis]
MHPRQPRQQPHPFPSEAPPPIDARTRQLADLPNEILHLLLLEIPSVKTLENILVADPALFFPLADARLPELVDSIPQHRRLSAVRRSRLHETVWLYDITLAVDADRWALPMYIGREFSPSRMRGMILALRSMWETSNEVVAEEFETWRAYKERVDMLPAGMFRYGWGG